MKVAVMASLLAEWYVDVDAAQFKYSVFSRSRQYSTLKLLLFSKDIKTIIYIKLFTVTNT